MNLFWREMNIDLGLTFAVGAKVQINRSKHG
jgi:hypothetical protein